MRSKFSSIRYMVGAILALMCCMTVPLYAQETDQGGSSQSEESEDETVYHGTYYEQQQINAGLPRRDMADRLRTPQATLEHFVLSARTKDFQSAAYALNLALIPVENQAAQAPDLARQLYYLLQQHALIDWDSLPDRPDGQIDTASEQNKNPLVGVPRRNIRLGDIALDGRSVSIRLQRVKADEHPPIWVFSASTVENITLLYNQYSPGFLAEHAPAWARVTGPGGIELWEWAMLLVMMLVSGGVSLLIHRAVDRAFRTSPNLWWRGLTATIATPAATFGSLMVLFVSTRALLGLTGAVTRFFDHALILLLVITGTWLIMSTIKFITDYVIEQHVLNETERDIEHARQLATYLFVGRRMVLFLALLVGTMLLLNALGIFEQLSISLLASAGLFTVIFGVAAQRFLGDIIAGVQIALTQPVRVGDTIEFEEAWGVVERITYTYLTIHTWDERRVMVPLQYLMSHPVQNLTKTGTNLIKPIYLHVDYHTDVEQIRQAFADMLDQDEDWDRSLPPLVHVTDITHETMQVRLLCSANEPDKAWYLRFRLSEKLMAYLRDLEGGHYLPKQRMVIEHAGHFNGQQHPYQESKQRQHVESTESDGQDGPDRE